MYHTKLAGVAVAIDSRGAAICALGPGGIIEETEFTRDCLPEDIVAWFEDLQVSEVVVEIPRMSESDIRASFNLGWWVGLLEAHGIRVETVSPDMWQFCVLKTDTRARQTTIVKKATQFCQESYGFQRVNYTAAKAVCLAHYITHFSDGRVVAS